MPAPPGSQVVDLPWWRRRFRLRSPAFSDFCHGLLSEVSDLHVLSGNPVLVSAAIEAVKQWRYAPCHLNSEPVEVKTGADVQFTLNQ